MAKGRIKRSFELIGASISVLRKNKGMLLFPISSLILGLLVTCVAGLLLYLPVFFKESSNKNME